VFQSIELATTPASFVVGVVNYLMTHRNPRCYAFNVAILYVCKYVAKKQGTVSHDHRGKNNMGENSKIHFTYFVLPASNLREFIFISARVR
jgi:hypothetical protein